MMSKTFTIPHSTLGERHYQVTSSSWKPGKKTRQGHHKNSTATLVGSVNQIDPDGTEQVISLNAFKQIYADFRCNGSVDEATEQIESEMVAAYVEDTDVAKTRRSRGEASRKRRYGS